MKKKSLSVILPVYNEADVIENVVKKFHKEIIKKYPNSTLIIAEDGSNDGTKEILRKLNKKIKFKLITSNDRKGYLKAVKDALQLGKTDLIFFSDTDDTHDPKDFWKLYKKINEADIVAGVKENRQDSFYRLFLSRCYNTFLGLVFGLWIRDSNAGFKLMKRDVVKKIVPKIKHIKYGFSSELLIRAKNKGFKIESVSVKHFTRSGGKADQFKLSRIPTVIYTQLKGMAKLRAEI